MLVALDPDDAVEVVASRTEGEDGLFLAVCMVRLPDGSVGSMSIERKGLM